MYKKFHNKKQVGKKYKPVQGIKTTVQDDLLGKFLEHVQSSPTSTAIMTSEGSLTYQALCDEVLSWKAVFSQRLQGRKRVIVCLDRTPRLVAVLLALQWLEITYIPVDLSLPFERLKTIMEDSQANAFLYDTEKHADYTNLDCLQLNLANLERERQQTDDEYPQFVQLKQDAIVYIIYTSGSTGKPKGIAISRYAFNNFLASMSRYFLQEEEALLLAITTLAFDIAVLELFLPLWQKKTVFLANEEQRKDIASLTCLLNDYPITLLQATPSMWKLLATMKWHNKANLVALCGGEPLNSSLAKSLLTEVAELWNMYGPTEATVWCSLKKIIAGEPITIGHPIDNTEMCVMDAAYNILPPYVKGELYIAGHCLAQGYVNNEKLINKLFIPWDDVIGGRLFNVGDIACTTPDGEFIIFGRTDNQIKLHGYRIEPEDIEAQIQRLTIVHECAVSVYNEQLIVYLCLSEPEKFSEMEFRKALAVALPDYMIPQRIILLDKLPLLTSGKIDRKALSSFNISKTRNKDTTTVLTPTQLLLTHIWETELGVPTLGLNDNFFDLGGHSLSAARIALKIASQMGKQVRFQDFYSASTLVEFAELVAKAPPSEQIDESKIKKLLANNQWLPLCDFQLTLWSAMFFETAIKKFNNTARRRIQGSLDKKILDLALQLVVQKQDILTYTINHLYPAQKQQTKWSIQWHETSLLNQDDETCEDLLAQSFHELFFQPLWYSKAPMIMAKLFYLKDEQVELQISISHFLSDGDSMEIFFQELSNAYLFYAHNTTLNASESPQAFISYILKQNELTTQNTDSDITFWGQYLEDSDFLYFPQKNIVNKVKPDSSFSTYYEIPGSMLSKLRQFCVKNQLTINDVLSAAIGLSLVHCGVVEDRQTAKLFINLVRSTRNDPKYDKVIGCFINVDCIKLDWHKHKTLLSLAKQAHQSAMETIEYQHVPSLVKYAYLCRKSRFKKWLIILFTTIFARLFCRFNLYPTLLKSLVTLVLTKPKNSFLINVNIFSNFSSETKQEATNLFDAAHRAIPLYPYPIILVKDLLDVTFHRNGEQNKPFMVITSNVISSFREDFGKTLLAILQRELES